MDKAFVINLFRLTKEHVASVRNIATTGAVNYEEVTRLYYRAAHLTLLDVLLDRHREEFSTISAQLDGNMSLQHKLLTKYKWPLGEIRHLSLEDICLALHDELKIDNFDQEISTYFTTVLEKYDPLFFPDYINEEWDPLLYLQVERLPRY
ncbi:hypothetical protein A9993_04015 [Rahnella victoriana]|uniref:ECs1072 family phage-associated protein n=1 Tax=Rahnella victoriana TaxID=1510570 RepID=UPI000BB16C0A|nr:hypothetical protein [Rahnella victoriana]PBI78938.1 hypothetical protein A9993_04015 [Rahnella victoriana]